MLCLPEEELVPELVVPELLVLPVFTLPEELLWLLLSVDVEPTRVLVLVPVLLVASELFSRPLYTTFPVEASYVYSPERRVRVVPDTLEPELVPAALLLEEDTLSEPELTDGAPELFLTCEEPVLFIPERPAEEYPLCPVLE